MIPSKLRSLYRVHSLARSIAQIPTYQCVAGRDSQIVMFRVCRDHCTTCFFFVNELKRLKWGNLPSPFKVDAVPRDLWTATSVEPELVKP